MAEKIIIEGKHASLYSDGPAATAHKILLQQLAEGMQQSTVAGLCPEPLPDNIKWIVRLDQLTLCIIQLLPERRWIKWLAPDSPAPFGPESKYVEYSLATPYVILKVPFWDHRIVPRIEVFYRNEPLSHYEGEGGALYWPNLYNVSVNAYGLTAWYCSQHLPASRRRTDIAAGLNNVVHHLFGGGFNASSEMHEGLSTFGLCGQEKVDPRVIDVSEWQKATVDDPNFVLKVAWKPTGLTVKDLIERELKFHNLPAYPQNVKALGNILLRQTKPK
jgi:hypothetical protein